MDLILAYAEYGSSLILINNFEFRKKNNVKQHNVKQHNVKSEKQHS